MPYPAAAIANYMLDHAQEVSQPLTQINIQKLVYFAHGWYLGINGAPLIEEPIEAWQYGPVVRRLYDAFRRFGSSVIDAHANEYRVEAGNRFVTFTPQISSADVSTQAFVGSVFKQYGSLAAFKLVELTHVSGSPWERAWSKRDNVIPNSEIQAYFASLTPQRG